MGTAFGVVLGLSPIPALSAFGVWIILVLITRIVSVGSICAGLVLPLAMLVEKQISSDRMSLPLLIFGIIIGCLVVITHRGNIKRLIRGEENKFGQSSKTKEGKI